MIRIWKFETRYKGDRGEDWVLISPTGEAGNRTQTWHMVKTIRPPEEIGDDEGLSMKAMRAKWEVIGPAYAAWKEGNEIPENGTPLVAWPALDAGKVEALKRAGIRTVEEVRSMNEATMKALPFPEARKLPKLAGQWLDGQGEARMAETIEQQKEQLDAMAQMIADLQAAQEKPKRGKAEKAAA